MLAGSRREVTENSKSRVREKKIRIKIMIKTFKLQLNQPDATAAHPDRNHAEIIADAQHAARLDAG
jgi:hypothetical protein